LSCHAFSSCDDFDISDTVWDGAPLRKTEEQS
jgi:hypothetical protein